MRFILSCNILSYRPLTRHLRPCTSTMFCNNHRGLKTRHLPRLVLSTSP